MKTGNILLVLSAVFLCTAAVVRAEATPPAPERIVQDDADASLEERLKPLKESALKGNLQDARRVYMRYGLAGRPREAREWAARYTELLTKQAEGGDTAAMLQLGSRYLTGADYTPPDRQQAVTWFSRASEAGAASGAYILGDIFAKTGNAPMAEQSYKRAFKLYSEEYEKNPGNCEVLYWLGFMQQNGIGTEKDPAAGIEKLRQAGEAGSAPADAQLFRTYYRGLGVPQDKAAALSYARRSADRHNDAVMAYIAARAYLEGRDVPQDTALGETYLDRAARAGLPDAVYVKARRLENQGQSEQALLYYRRAAGMQQRDAVLRLGQMMLHGAPGTEQDTERALATLQHAAGRLRSPAASLELAHYYESVGEQDVADSWYILASEQGAPAAMGRRGLLHMLPTGKASWNPTRAWQWWQTGKRAGDRTCALYANIFLYGFIPLLLVFVFGLPLLIAHFLNRRVRKREEEGKGEEGEQRGQTP